jgi:hypothetical protein
MKLLNSRRCIVETRLIATQMAATTTTTATLMALAAMTSSTMGLDGGHSERESHLRTTRSSDGGAFIAPSSMSDVGDGRNANRTTNH